LANPSRRGLSFAGDLFGVWRDTRQLVLAAQVAAIYAAVLIPFKVGIPIIPGFVELRPANAIPVLGAGVPGHGACRRPGAAGARPGPAGGNVVVRAGRYVPLMVPLMTHVIRQTLLLAMALEAKGFDPSATRVRADESRFTAADYVVLAGLAVLLLLCLWLRWNGYGVVGGVGF
jgi:hypothetical protein